MAGIEQFVLDEYVGGLARLGRASQAGSDALFAKLGGLAGLAPKLVAPQHGRVGAEVFVKSLLRDRNPILDRCDGRQASDDPLPEHAEFASLDRTLTVLNGMLSSPNFDCLSRALGYKSDRRDILPNLPNLPANARWDRSSPMGSPEGLACALTLNTGL